jgi:hypothetical protein
MPGHDNRHFVLRDGPAGFLLIHNATWYHDVIERLDLGTWDDWGWAFRDVTGMSSGVISNHASGTAVDLNATRHPRGVPLAHTFTASQISKIRRRLALYHGCIRWGGDYQHSPLDPMHFEINAGEGAVRARAVSLLNTPRGREVVAANPGARKAVLG